ncbi:hypothetical protein G6F68_010126 [Rhizopus microsporus]|nr:hypothetical protein G6F68_010126 [Rhizopus microsporus]
MGVQALVQRQQRGVDVDQAALEALHEGSPQDAHVAGTDDPVRRRCLHGIAERLLIGGAVAELLRRVCPAQARCHPLQRCGTWTVGEHADHVGRQAAVADRVEDGLQIAATAGGQYRNASGHATTAPPGSLKLAATSARSSTIRAYTPSAMPSAPPRQAAPAATRHNVRWQRCPSRFAAVRLSMPSAPMASAATARIAASSTGDMPTVGVRLSLM